MKQQLLDRLQLMDKSIQDKHLQLENANKALQQANADLNMLNGCRQELVHIINLCDAEALKPVAEPVNDNGAVLDVNVPDSLGEAV